MSEDVFNWLVEQRLQRIMLEDSKKKKETTNNNLREHWNFVENTYNDKQERHQELQDLYDECTIRMEQLKYNFEVIIYILQGQVEVP